MITGSGPVSRSFDPTAIVIPWKATRSAGGPPLCATLTAAGIVCPHVLPHVPPPVVSNVVVPQSRVTLDAGLSPVHEKLLGVYPDA